MKSLVFSVNELYKNSTQSERRNLELTEEIFSEKTTIFFNELANGTYAFSFKKNDKIFLNSKKNDFEFLFQNLVLRKIYRNVKTVYKLSQSNRDEIISQMQVLLNEESPYWILRLDIKSFYESLNYRIIIEKLENDYRLNSQTICYINELFKQLSMENNGIPRGVCVSAIFAEFYMKDFDLKVKRMDGVYYYARFVDDIILFCNSESSLNETKKKIEEELQEKKLELNEKKIKIWNRKSRDILTYLGYEFRHRNNKVDISIAEKKIKMIKTRIVKSFINYTKNRDVSLLKKRIKFLTGNIVLKNSNLDSIFVGIYYNYKKITNYKVLEELDLFYQKMLNCKNGKIGSVLSTSLSIGEKKDLRKYSFKFGFEKKVRHKFKIEEMKQIKRCWL